MAVLQAATSNFYRGLDVRFSITLMCWVGGQDGPLVSYGDWGVMVAIEHGKFLNQMVVNFFILVTTRTTEVLPAGKWVHVVASYNYSSGNNSVYINGHLRASHKIYGYRIAKGPQRVRMGVKDQFNGYFKGKIAEMKVYELALNKVQIQTLIRQGSCTFSEIIFSLLSLVIP